MYVCIERKLLLLLLLFVRKSHFFCMVSYSIRDVACIRYRRCRQTTVFIIYRGGILRNNNNNFYSFIFFTQTACNFEVFYDQFFFFFSNIRHLFFNVDSHKEIGQQIQLQSYVYRANTQWTKVNVPTRKIFYPKFGINIEEG